MRTVQCSCFRNSGYVVSKDHSFHTCLPYFSCLALHYLSQRVSNTVLTQLSFLNFSNFRSKAWVGAVVNANDAHPVVECSNKGSCDRKTGECACFENYEGIACERTICPNRCSDAGVCFTESQLAQEAAENALLETGSASNIRYTQPWDAEKHVGCVCDIGRRGPDCSLSKSAPYLFMSSFLPFRFFLHF